MIQYLLTILTTVTTSIILYEVMQLHDKLDRLIATTQEEP